LNDRKINQQTRIVSEVDFDREGRQQGFLRLPYSSHRSAYGWLPIPIIVLKNGDGPNVLLMAGNHGDEYEGQVTLMKLCRELNVADVRGRIIILPAANAPAARAGMRTSPIDGGNLNRSFPGDADGSPTQMIAHYIEATLLPRVEYVLDLHSGGSSLMYIPSTLMMRYGQDDKTDKAIELLRVFNAPIGYIGKFPGEDRTLSAAAQRAGVIHVGTELGGSGTVTPQALAIAERGVRRVLKHLGSTPAMVVTQEPQPSRLMELGGSDYYVYSPDEGLWEPLVELGDEVQSGQAAALVHFPETPWREPQTAHFQHAGTVLCKRIPGRVERGDCLFHLGTDL
jgi:predicted deacylase